MVVEVRLMLPSMLVTGDAGGFMPSLVSSVGSGFRVKVRG